MKAQSTFYQNLIVCIYKYNEFENDGLERGYHHFIASDSKVKNNIGFVVGVWKMMVEQNFFEGVERVHIFSDGGPKHFKITSNISFFNCLQNHLKIPINYHFFASHHGHSVCDGVSAHAKYQLNRIQRITQKPITFSFQIVNIIETIKNHHAQLAEVEEVEETFATFQGIRKIHKFTFNNNQASGFSLSKDENPTKTYNCSEHNFF